MQEFVFENRHIQFILGSDGTATRLYVKASGEELISPDSVIPAFSATQDRPYNNEIKLAYMNKKTTFHSDHIELDELGRLSVKFGLFPFRAIIEVGVTEEYITFTLVDFTANPIDYPDPMDFPPVTELTLLRLPFDKALPYGSWMNVVHTDTACAAVMAASPHPYIDAQCTYGRRILSATARRGIRLKGCTVALVAAPKPNFLDAVASLEEDYNLPRGVNSRRQPLINASIYWTADLNPGNVDAHIAKAKQGGFRLMLLYYTCMCTAHSAYDTCGDYFYNGNYPNGEADMRLVIDKIKAAGITPGMHFLHTHIGIASQYVTPKADRRLNLIRYFTLSLPLSEDGDTVYVDETPLDCPTRFANSRLLRFDGEIISYESYTTEPPYAFTGCKRGIYNTKITSHEADTIGGVLDVSEYSGTSIYLKQDSNLQDEVAGKLAEIFNCGFEFIYFDGSEGANAPFDYHIPNAQYRVYRQMNPAPLFCEGAAKAHFGWHMLSGGNAFDVFPVPIFKEMILEHPFREAQMMKNDFTRVNFGWWSLNADTRVDTYEFGTSKAAAWDCPVTLQMYNGLWNCNPRFDDIFEMMRRWEDIREKGLLSEEDKEKLRDPGTEYTLLIDREGKYLLLPYYEVRVADPEGPDAVIGKPRKIGREVPVATTVRAFVFEHQGNACAVLWDDKGERQLTLTGVEELSYTRELETGPIPYAKEGENIILPVFARAYLRAAGTMEALAAALKNGTVTE